MNYYRLAQAAEAIGRDDLALPAWTGPAQARPSESDRRRPARRGGPRPPASAPDEARPEGQGGRRLGRGRPPVRRRRRAAATDRDRLAARLELAEVQLARGEARASVAILQALLADERLRALSVDAADGHRSIRADLLIADRLAALLRDKGPRALRRLRPGRRRPPRPGPGREGPRLLEDVGRSYPVARVVPEAWLALAELYEDAHRPGDSARAYKRLLAGAPDDAPGPGPLGPGPGL